MRRLAAAALLVFPLGIISAAAQPVEPDPIGTLLINLQNALAAGRTREFVDRSAPDLSVTQAEWLTRVTGPDGATTVTIRERARTNDFVIAEVFVAENTRAFVANWRLSFSGPSIRSPQLASIVEISAFRDLLQLQLDSSRQFAVENLRLTGPDFTLTLASGTAFVADVSDGTTAIVLQGRSRIRFAPPSPTEQGQLRIFAGRSDLVIDAEDVFVRVNPRQLHESVAWSAFTPVAVAASALEHARDVFSERSGLSYHFELGDLAGSGWSVEPVPDSMLVDIRTRRFGWLTYARSPDDPEDVSFFDRARRRQISLYASPERLALASSAAGTTESAYDVLDTRVDVTFDPARLWMSGRVSLRIALSRDAASVPLRLASSLVVSSISSPELGPMLPLRVSGHDSLIIGLPPDVLPGRAFTVDIQYHGRVVPQPAAHEASGLLQETERSDRDFPLNFEPRYLYSNRSLWYPQPMTLHHGTAGIRITVPSEYGVLASGRLFAETLSRAADRESAPVPAQVRTFEFHADQPVRYLACLITRLNPGTHATVEVPTLTRAPGESGRSAVAITLTSSPRQAGRVTASTTKIASIIQFYAQLFGEAPYPSFTLASLEDTVPGGHSPAFFAVINQPHPATSASWSRDPVAFADVDDFFLAHEIAHQWWGQSVGWRDYHEQWLSEGFAQYFAWMYIASTTSTEVSERVMSRMRETAMQNADEGPVHLGYRLGHLRGNTRIFRSIVYNKSAVVLHMLRRLMGDDAFLRGARRVYQTWRFRRAATADVQRAFQTETTIPLDRFFRFWILEPATPVLRLTWTRTDANQGVVRVQQTGSVADFPYDITLRYRDGSRERRTIVVTEADTTFTVTGRMPIDNVEFADHLTLVELAR